MVTLLNNLIVSWKTIGRGKKWRRMDDLVVEVARAK